MSCPVCGGTTVYRKSNVVLDVKIRTGGMWIKTPQVNCTVDLCGGCGRMTQFVQDPQEWLQEVGYDAVFETGDA